ncbi:MAG: phosphatidate cytidylyltransferase [Methylocystis sp.]
MDQASRDLFVGVLAVLVLATTVDRVLAWRAGGERDATLRNLGDRIYSWWVMVGVLALAFLLGRFGVLALFASTSFLALREFLTLMRTRRGDHWALFASFFFVLPIQYALIGADWYGLYSIFIPVYAFLFLPIVAVLRGDTRAFTERVAELQWGLMTCVFCVSHLPALLTLDIPGFAGRNASLVAFLIIVVQGSDVLQYVWGKLFGKTKIAPTLSPSKTVEGFVGGIASSTLLGAALWGLTPFTPLQAGGMALAASLMGFFGGLVMSAIKRDRGVKDWGEAIRGHGGMLDRLDSIIFGAPIFFHLTRYWFAV